MALNEIKKLISELEEISADEYNELTQAIYEKMEFNHNPVSNVRFVKVDDVEPNDYNPNAVAKQEMKLLYTSIKHDGYTQPTVTVFDEERGKYVIVDGFHRYYVMKSYSDIYNLNNGYMPIVVIDKDINDRMASTVRHNRARGKHSLTGMGHIVMSMVENGVSDSEICNELGLEPDELVRLKYTTGIAELFADSDYTPVGKPKYQVEREYDPTLEGSEPVEDERLINNFKNVRLD